jgi:hypothetical protein
MIKIKRYLMMMAACLLVACSSDSPEEPLPPVPPTPTPVDPEEPEEPKVTGNTLYLGDIVLFGATRASDPVTQSSIELYTTYKDGDGVWTYDAGRVTRRSDNVWQSLVTVKKDVEYWIYGFMPADAVVNPQIDYRPNYADYSKGVVFKFNGLPAVTKDDLCMLVGAKKYETANPAAVEGKFYYKGVDNDNKVSLKFTHLFASLDFQIRVADDYDKLRIIQLKKMQLESSLASLDATVRITNEGTPVMDTKFTKNAGSHTADITLNDTDGKGLKLTTTSQKIAGFCAPNFSETVTLITTYDVYDKQGNLLRENCTVRNKMPNLSKLKSGDKKTLKLLIQPTYLYVLSDPDLDSPTVELN